MSAVGHGGQKRACALHRAEYVKSKDLVNASRGRKTSGVAGEALASRDGLAVLTLP
jgi:hypothetical protein